MRPFKPFWGWTKNTFSLPEIIIVFSTTFLPQKISLPPTYLPLPPSWFRAHSIARAQELLKGKHEQHEQEHRKWEGSKRIASKCGRRVGAPGGRSGAMRLLGVSKRPKRLKRDPRRTQNRGKLPFFFIFLQRSEEGDGKATITFFFLV